MNNLNDMEKYDSIFRIAASDYELPYEEDSWVLMQQKLDAVLDKKKKRGIWWWFPVVIIAASAGIYIYTNQSKSLVATTITDKPTEIKIDTKKTNTNDVIDNTTKENASEDYNHTAPKSEIQKTASSNKEKTTSIPQNQNIENKQVRLSHLKESILIKKSVLDKIKQRQSTTVWSANNNIGTPESANATTTQAIKNDYKTTTTNSVIIDNTLKSISGASSNNMYTANILYMHNRYIPNYKQLEKDNIAITAKRMEIRKALIEEESRPMIRPIVPNLPTSSNWFLTASLSNNIGYVSNPQISNGHLQFQLGIGYNFSRNISLQTGIAFGNRTFDMRKDQFAYKGPGAYAKYIRNIHADISIIDIPITFRYQFSDKENFGWFYTAGISSVFSKKEDYVITVDNGTAVTYLNQNFENTPSWMSMLNLSVGYQYILSKKMTLTVEPYLQLPFKTIGQGGSKLCSAGLQIGARYHFPKKKK